MSFLIRSPAFDPEHKIPQRYTCEGNDISPPLFWSDIPDGTQSLALIMEDPDAPDPEAPKRIWVHWILYNMPVTTHALTEDIKPEDLPEGTIEGINSWNRTGYGGPCPPIGQHRYFFNLYALSKMLPDVAQLNRNQLLKQMHGSILRKTELMGLYKSKG